MTILRIDRIKNNNIFIFHDCSFLWNTISENGFFRFYSRIKGGYSMKEMLALAAAALMCSSMLAGCMGDDKNSSSMTSSGGVVNDVISGAEDMVSDVVSGAEDLVSDAQDTVSDVLSSR